MIERVARALARRQIEASGSIGDGPMAEATKDKLVNGSWPGFSPAARAAIAAMREPTDAMVINAMFVFAEVEPYRTGSITWDDMRAYYRAMIDAALKP
jgi:hypothetical protein